MPKREISEFEWESGGNSASVDNAIERFVLSNVKTVLRDTERTLDVSLSMRAGGAVVIDVTALDCTIGRTFTLKSVLAELLDLHLGGHNYYPQEAEWLLELSTEVKRHMDDVEKAANRYLAQKPEAP